MQSKLENPVLSVTADDDAMTLDRVMRLQPSVITDADLQALVEGLRRDRARFIAAEQAKEAKKEGVEEVGYGDSE